MKDQCRGRLIDARCRRRTLSVIPAPIHFSRILSDRHAQQWSKRGVNRIPNNHLLTKEQGYIGRMLPFTSPIFWGLDASQQCVISFNPQGHWHWFVSQYHIRRQHICRCSEEYLASGPAKLEKDNQTTFKDWRQAGGSKIFFLAFSTTLASVCFLLDTFPRLKVRNKSGLTVDGLQEYYDEACLAVLNNRLVLKIETQDKKKITKKRVMLSWMNDVLICRKSQNYLSSCARMPILCNKVLIWIWSGRQLS